MKVDEPFLMDDKCPYCDSEYFYLRATDKRGNSAYECLTCNETVLVDDDHYLILHDYLKPKEEKE